MLLRIAQDGSLLRSDIRNIEKRRTQIPEIVFSEFYDRDVNQDQNDVYTCEPNPRFEQFDQEFNLFETFRESGNANVQQRYSYSPHSVEIPDVFDDVKSPKTQYGLDTRSVDRLSRFKLENIEHKGKYIVKRLLITARKATRHRPKRLKAAQTRWPPIKMRSNEVDKIVHCERDPLALKDALSPKSNHSVPDRTSKGRKSRNKRRVRHDPYLQEELWMVCGIVTPKEIDMKKIETKFQICDMEAAEEKRFLNEVAN